MDALGEVGCLQFTEMGGQGQRPVHGRARGMQGVQDSVAPTVLHGWRQLASLQIKVQSIEGQGAQRC